MQSSFSNRSGQEWIFEYNPQTKLGIIKGTNVEQQEYPVINGQAEGLSLNDEESTWLRQSWATAVETPRPNAAALEILNGRHVASLATQRPDGSIHLTAIWYLYLDGLLYFATGSQSQKVRHVEAHPVASMMIDTRVPGQEQGVTASGSAIVIRSPNARTLVAEVHRRYLTEIAINDPKVGGVYARFDDAVICLLPQRWSTWNIGKMNADNFDGILSVESGYLHPYSA